MTRKLHFTPAQLPMAVALTQYCAQHSIPCSMLHADSATQCYHVTLDAADVGRLISYYLADGNAAMLAYVAGELNKMVADAAGAVQGTVDAGAFYVDAVGAGKGV